MELNLSNITFYLKQDVHGCHPYKWYYSEITPGVFELISAILDCLISVFSVFVNGLVIFTIHQSTNLHSPSNLLIAGLAMSDFGTGLITHPSHVIEYVAAVRGDNCTANIAFMVINISGWLFTILSLTTLTFIAVERYCAVVFHLRYNEKVTVRRTMIVLLSIWFTVPLASTLIAVKKLKALNFLLAHAFIILIGIFITCLCYFKVFLVLRRHYGQISIQLQAQSLQQPASNAAHYRRKFFTVLYIVGAFVACYLPYSIAVLARFEQRNRMTMLAVLGGNSCLNPLIYFWRIRELREAAKSHVAKIVKCCRNNQ